MFPDKEVISYSDNLLGITPFYVLFRVWGTDYLTAFQLLIFLCHVLNFLTCFYALHKLTGNKYAAATGAFIFAFSLALNGIHNHPQFTFRFCIPLFFYHLHQYLTARNLKSLLYSVAFLVLQFYLGVYLGYFLTLFGALYFLSFNLAHYKSFSWQMLEKYVIHIGISAGGAIVTLLPIFYFYYKRNQITGYYTDFNQVLATIPQIPSYFKSHSGSVMWHSLSATPVLSEYSWFHTLFPGALVFACLFASVYLVAKNYNKQLLISILLLLLLAFALTTNFNGNTFYDNLLHIPGFKAIRVVSRLILVLLFPFSWIVCLTVKYVFDCYSKAAKIVIMLLPVILFADNFCKAESFKTFSKSECRQRIDAIKNKILSHPDYKNYSAFAYIPASNEEAYKLQIDAMLCAVNLKWKTVNGYSSSCHGKFGPVWENHDSTSVVTWLKEMNTDYKSVLFVK